MNSNQLSGDNSEIIADESQTITEEVLDKAKQQGKFTELSMNTKA